MPMGPFCKALGKSLKCTLVAFSWELSHLFSQCFPGVKTGSALITELGNMISYWLLSWMSTKINCASAESPDGNATELEIQATY